VAKLGRAAAVLEGLPQPSRRFIDWLLRVLRLERSSLILLDSIFRNLSMTHPSAYHQLGRFIVMFQHLERAINELIYLMTDISDDPAITNLNLTRRIDATDRLFSEFVAAKAASAQHAQLEFHGLMTDLKALADRRNVLVHSRYAQWVNLEGREGLLRSSTRIDGEKRNNGAEEELQPEAFDSDIERLSIAAKRLERFRLKIIDWSYPDE
jgi:hypothetical protein